MQILEMPEFRKLAEAYRNGYLSFTELKEELEGCWEKTLQGTAKTHLVERTSGPLTSISERDR